MRAPPDLSGSCSAAHAGAAARPTVHAQLASVVALCSQLRWVFTLRAVCAAAVGYGLWRFVFGEACVGGACVGACVGGRCDPWAPSKLLYILTAWHLCSCVAIDEAVLLNALAAKSGALPMALRLLAPGSPVTPALPGLPRRQSVVGALAYAGYVGYTVYALAAPDRFGAREVLYSAAAFCVASVFDVGLFISTRPSDILKFAVLSAATGSQAANWVMIGFLYLHSGTAKLRGYFWGWIFPYQFLLPSAVSWYFQGMFLDRTTLQPTVSCSLFGYAGVLTEAVVGVLMLSGVQAVAMPAACVATAMHGYISFFGIGPHRWNQVHVYMLWCALNALPAGDGAVWAALHWYSFLYVAFFCLLVPAVGYVSPDLLGKYLGGYRMATFHFVGNEAVHGYFVRRTVAARLAEAVSEARAGKDCRRWHALLKERVEACESMLEDPNVLQMMYYTDGMDFGPVIESAASKAGLELREFCDEYVYVSMFMLNAGWAMLNTKWDESVACISQRFARGVREGLSPLGEGDVILFETRPLAYVAGEKTYTVGDMCDPERTTERYSAGLPWLALQPSLRTDWVYRFIFFSAVGCLSAAAITAASLALAS